MSRAKRYILIIGIAVFTLAIAFVVLKVLPKYSADNLIVLMYHDVQDDADGSNSAVVATGKIDADFDWIAKNGYEAVLPRDLLDPNFSLPRKAVVISFDDGYKSNYEKVYPMLSKYGLKAEINVITSLIDDDAYTNFCSWDDLREMHESGLVEIGSHTHNLHNPNNGGMLYQDGPNGVQRLDNEADAEYEKRVTKDILLSKEKIEKELGTKPTCFAYPYGALDKDSSNTVMNAFDISFGVTAGTNSVAASKHNLHRYQVTNTTDISEILKK